MSAALPNLRGLRVLLTRAAVDNRAWAAALAEAGAEVEALACIEIRTLPAGDALCAAAPDADWLVAGSRRAVEELATYSGLPLPELRAVVGPATRERCEELLGPVTLTAPDGTLASLANALAERLAGTQAALVHATADRGRDDLAELLVPLGHEVRRVPLYATLPASGLPVRPALAPEGLDAPNAIVVASPSALEGLLAQRDVARDLPLVVLGPTTRDAAREADFTHITEASTRDVQGVARALATLSSRTGS